MKYITYTRTLVRKKYPVVKSILPPIPFHYSAIRNVSTLDKMLLCRVLYKTAYWQIPRSIEHYDISSPESLITAAYLYYLGNNHK